MERLEAETDSLRTLAVEAAATEVSHKAGYAKALLLADGPMDARKAAAEVECEQAYLARRISEAHYNAQRELLHSIRAQLDALRSIGADERSAGG